MRKLLFIFCFALMGCEPQPLEIDNLDIIIIDPSNSDFYKLNHASDSGMGWVETKNGIIYSFYFEDNKVIITSNRKMKAAYKMKSPGKEQTNIEENTFSYPVNGLTTFRIYY